MDPVGLELAGEVAVAGFVEPVGEDLVEDPAFVFRRYGVAGGDAAQLPIAALFNIRILALFEKAELLVAGGNPEIVEEETRGVQGEVEPVVLVELSGVIPMELEFPEKLTVFFFHHQHHPRGLTGAGDGDGHSADLPRRQHAEGGLMGRTQAVIEYP